MISWCCESECYERDGEWICQACGAKKQKTASDLMQQLYDDQRDLALDHAVQAVTGQELSRESIWRCMDGRRVAIKDMVDSHLLNTIRVLDGKSPHGTTFKCDPVRRREYINVMANEAYRRGLQLL